jgi:hypothetical protein
MSDMRNDVIPKKGYSFGDYEKETKQTSTRHLHYIQGGDGLAAAYIKNGYGTMAVLMRDHTQELLASGNLSRSDKKLKVKLLKDLQDA